MKKFTSVFFLLMCILLFVSCESSSDKEQKAIYNNNDKIINSKDSYNAFETKDNSNEDHIKFTYGTFYGLKTIKTISTNNDNEIDLKLTCKLASGNFKVVLVDGEKNMQTLFEGNDNESKRVKLKKGENKIRIVGNDAKNVDIDLEISET